MQWLAGFSKLGMIVQGIHHGPTALVGGLPNFGLREIKWNVGLTGQHRFNKFILSAELQSVNTKNYAWEKGNNRFNFYGFLTATYLW